MAKNGIIEAVEEASVDYSLSQFSNTKVFGIINADFCQICLDPA